MKNFLIKYKNAITNVVGFIFVLQPVYEWFATNTTFTLKELAAKFGIAVIGYLTGKPTIKEY